MKLLIIMATMVLFSGCGLHVSSDPVKVEGNVTQTVVIDPTEVQEVLTSYCKSKYTVQAEVDTCVSEQLALFWNAINFSSAPTPSPTPSSGG